MFSTNQSDIEWLLLEENLLEDFDLNLFRNLHQMKVLNLTNNRITMKDMHFPELAKLQEL